MIKHTLLGGLAALLLALGGLAATQDAGTPPAKQLSPAEQEAAAKAEVIRDQSASYPLDGCVISGEKFSAESPAVDVVAAGRLVRVCCKKCAAKVEKEPSASIAKIDEAVIAQQKELWPLKACPVSGEPYGGEMGEPLDMVVGTRYVKLCCGGCKKGVNKDPRGFIAKLDELVKPELAKTYPSKTCVVSGEPLDAMGGPVDVMYGHRLVRFCCKGCLKAYKKDPAGTVAKVYAPKKKTEAGEK